MLARLLFALPFTLIWSMITSFSLTNFALGLLLGVAIAVALDVEHHQISLRRMPGQFAALALYLMTLARETWLSSLDVTRHVLRREMKLRPGLLRVPIQDDQESEVMAALSAHGITVAPGELVVDFEDSHIMLVHCLDAEEAATGIIEAQARRLRLFERILGR